MNTIKKKDLTPVVYFMIVVPSVLNIVKEIFVLSKWDIVVTGVKNEILDIHKSDFGVTNMRMEGLAPRNR